MKQRVLPGPGETSRLDTAGLRDAFVLSGLFAASEIRVAVTDMDRFVVGAAMPVEPLQLPDWSAFGAGYFTERREIGVVNLGDPGHIRVQDTVYSLDRLDFLYIGAGNPQVTFERCDERQPRFYFLSCPAHRALPVTRIGAGEVKPEPIGDARNASSRRIRKYIHPGGAASCQLVMGMTELDAGSVWNTMPPHTHSRRSEVYLYYGLEDGVVLHLMGEPRETRHLIVRDREAVLSPSWSVHCGAGTRPYSFVWGMAGENQLFSDMDHVELDQLR